MIARVAVAALGALTLAGGLAGCGFTPLYATPGVSSGLAHIEVVVPDGRTAYLLREDLDDAFGRDKGDTPQWRLTLTVQEDRAQRGLLPDNTSQRYEVHLLVGYTLTEIATGKVARSGQVFSQVSYDESQQPYNGIAARQDTQARAAEDAAQKIQIQLAAWLAARGKGGGPAPTAPQPGG